MRCGSCSTTWKLSGSNGPIGTAAPGHFLIVPGVLGALAIAAGDAAGPAAATAPGVLAQFILLMPPLGCGHKPSKDLYKGSQSPGCDRDSRIMPRYV